MATHREGVLRYVAELSAGWTREQWAELARRLPALARPEPIVPCRKQAVWLQPERYCRVRSLGWTHRGRLRGASLAGMIERSARGTDARSARKAIETAPSTSVDGKD